MSSLINQIKDAGVKTSNKKGSTTAYPCYMGNSGFFHLCGDGWSLIFLKGVYKDNIRKLNGECPYETKLINNLSQTLADCERTTREPMVTTILFEDDTYYITTAEPYCAEKPSSDMRNPEIEAPLTNVELSLGKSDSASSKHLFIHAPFAELMPEVLSPAAMSLFAAVPDVMNPLFMSCGIKTESPSIKMLFGRMFMNMKNGETIVPAFKQPADFFLLNYAPYIYKSLKKPDLGIPEDSDLLVSDAEITEAISDIKTSTKTIEQDDMFSDDFAELIALTFMAWEMVSIRLWKSFTSVHKILGKDIYHTLSHIYKTRSDSILNKTLENIMPSIDPACEPSTFDSCGIKHCSIDDMYKTIGSAKKLTLKKSKYTEKISAAHTYLRMRDDLYTAVSDLALHLRRTLLDTGKMLCSDSILTDPADIFHIELGEIKNILSDQFYGNLPFTINFRKWQNARFGALCIPYNIYEKDVEEAESIARKQLETSLKTRSIGCLNLLGSELSTDSYAVRKSWELTSLPEAAGKEAVLTEASSLFSFISEYCVCKDIQLCTGARFASVLIKEGRVTVSKDSVSF